jgi:hypothetical protein
VRQGWGMVVGLVYLARAATAAAAPSPAVLYLNFSDGREDVFRAENDNAAQNRSVMGSSAPFPAFAWPGMNDETARRTLVDELARQVNDAFLAYNVIITTHRPTSGAYTMVLVGGNPGIFSLDPRVAGIAFMDCDNRQATNVVFAFPASLGTSVHGLFATIAQEAAHAFGLQHSSNPDDLMYPRVDVTQRGFEDRESSVASPNLCGPVTQNSHRRLLELLGPWPGGDKPIDELPPPVEAPLPFEGGCAVAPAHHANGSTGLGGAALGLLFALRACRRRRGRL